MLTFNELLDKAEKLDIDPCLYCIYSHKCNGSSINNYGRGPVESPCVSHDIENWVDEDRLRECIEDYDN